MRQLLGVLLLSCLFATTIQAGQNVTNQETALLDHVNDFSRANGITVNPSPSPIPKSHPALFVILETLRNNLEFSVGEKLATTSGIFSLSKHGSAFRTGILDGVAHLAARQFIRESRHFGPQSEEQKEIDALLDFRKERARIVVGLDAEIRHLLNHHQQSGTFTDIISSLTDINESLRDVEEQLRNETDPVRINLHQKRRDELINSREMFRAISQEITHLFEKTAREFAAVFQEIDADIVANTPLIIGGAALNKILETDRHFGLGRLIVEYSDSLAEAMTLLHQAEEGASPEKIIWDALRNDPPPTVTLSVKRHRNHILSIERRGDTMSSVIERHGYSQKDLLAIERANPSINPGIMMVGDTFIVPASVSNVTIGMTQEEWLTQTEIAAREIRALVGHPVEAGHIRWDLYFSQERFPATPAGLLTALTIRETNAGSYLGTGRFDEDLRRSLWPHFFAWCAAWGIDPFLVPVSRGAGAIGETQFMPHTWSGFADHAREATGQPTPWLWNIRTAFAATSSYLNGRAGFQNGEIKESLLFYYMGSDWEEKLEIRYGDDWKQHISAHAYPRTILHNVERIQSILRSHNLLR